MIKKFKTLLIALVGTAFLGTSGHVFSAEDAVDGDGAPVRVAPVVGAAPAAAAPVANIPQPLPTSPVANIPQPLPTSSGKQSQSLTLAQKQSIRHAILEATKGKRKGKRKRKLRKKRRAALVSLEQAFSSGNSLTPNQRAFFRKIILRARTLAKQKLAMDNSVRAKKKIRAELREYSNLARQIVVMN